MKRNIIRLFVFGIGLLFCNTASGKLPPMHNAAKTGNINALQQQLAAGVDVNLKDRIGGRTALMWAVSR